MEKNLLICLMLQMAIAASMQSCQVKNGTLTCYLRTLQSADIDAAIDERDRVGISSTKKIRGSLFRRVLF